MTIWGVDNTGFVRPTFRQIRDELESRFRGRFGADRDTAHETPDGMMVDWAAEAVVLMLEAGESTYNAQFFDTVQGASLDLWMADRLFARRPALASTVTLTLSGTPGSVVPAGSRVRHAVAQSSWATDADATIGAGGTVDAVFTCATTGPLEASAGSAWVIETVIAGWASASNVAAAAPGRLIESDAAFKARYRTAIQLGAMGRALLKLDGVDTVAIFENDTDTPDPLYNRTHWVEALVVGGDDQEVADTVWRYKPKGTGTVGDSSMTELISGDGNPVAYSRGTEQDTWLTVEITAGEGFDTSTADYLRDELVAWANKAHAHGDDVAPDLFRGEIARLVPGRFSVAITVGASAPPSGTAGILTVSDRTVARFDASRTSVSFV